MKSLVEAQGPKDWPRIAELFNADSHNPNPTRNGKQCRERWFNALNTDAQGRRKGKWTVQEDIFLLNRWKDLGGNKWSEIAR